MTYVYRAPDPHKCPTPKDEKGYPAAPYGSIWRCDECGSHWHVWTHADDYGSGWWRLSERQLERRLRKLSGSRWTASRTTYGGGWSVQHRRAFGVPVARVRWGSEVVRTYVGPGARRRAGLHAARGRA